MFRFLFKHELVSSIRTRWVVFWTLLFPILLATLFYIAFNNLDQTNILDPVKVGVVLEDSAVEKQSKEIFKAAEEMIDAKYISLDTAKEQLRDGEITGYFTIDSEMDIKLSVAGNGMQQSILQIFANTWKSSARTIKDILTTDPMKLAKLGEDFQQETLEKGSWSVGTEPPMEKGEKFYYFFTLIGMTVMYGSYLSLQKINGLRADAAATGARIKIGPVSSSLHVTVAVLVSFFIEIICLLLLWAYLLFVLKLELHDYFGIFFLISAAGGLFGISFGCFFGSLIKNLNIAGGLTAGITMTGSFLSGMMGSTGLRYTIMQHIPWLDRINPVTLVTDGLYRVFYFEDFHSAYQNVIQLIGMCLLFFILSILFMRRNQYVSS